MLDSAKEIRQIISNTSGKLISTRMNEKYFTKIDKLYLYHYLISSTNYLPEDISFKHRLLFLESNYNSLPTCKICGKVHSRITTNYSKSDEKISDYCSMKCNYNDPEYSVSKKQMWNDVDKISANNKRKSSMKEKYGVEYNSQREDIKPIISKSTSYRYLNNDVYDKLNNQEWLDNQYNILQKSGSQIAQELDTYYGTVLEYCRKYGFTIRTSYKESLPEIKLYDYISSIYSGTIVKYDRTILKPKELDLYIPDKNIAIEINGIYSHSYDSLDSEKLGKFKHIFKTEKCNKQHIQLLHFPSSIIDEKFDIVKSIISSKLGISNKVFARKCEIVVISNKQLEKDFLENTHIQGYVKSDVAIGLYHNNELQCIISFGKPRFKNSKYNWELLRYSSKLHTTVIGGFSKLLNYFIKNYCNSGETIITYCDRSLSNGNVYSKNGFKFINNTQLDYYWTDKRTLFPRYKFMKNTLHNKLKVFDKNKSESYNMFNNGYRRYWGCGNMIFEYTVK